jgi:hypothetical protein
MAILAVALRYIFFDIATPLVPLKTGITAAFNWHRLSRQIVSTNVSTKSMQDAMGC